MCEAENLIFSSLLVPETFNSFSAVVVSRGVSFLCGNLVMVNVKIKIDFQAAVPKN